jgi:hypothetical protein
VGAVGAGNRVRRGRGGPLHGKPIEPADPTGAVDVMEWFTYAAAQAGPLLERPSGTTQDVQCSTQARGVPILLLDKSERSP